MTDRREKIAEFLDYGGDELFSQLMSSGVPRAEVLERYAELLKNYSDVCRRIKGRSAAYRFMLRRAAGRGWLGRNSGNTGAHRLTEAERVSLFSSLGEYISSGGRRAKIIRALLAAAAVAVVAAVLAVLAVREFNWALASWRV